MALYFKTPLGTLVPLTGLNPQVNGNLVLWNATLSETLGTRGEAQAYLAAVLAALQALPGTNAAYVEDLSTLLISVAANPFNPGTDTITVTGQGFVQSLLGLIHIEDLFGGPDDNGLTLLPVFVNSTTLTASLNTAGVNGGYGDSDPFASSSSSTPAQVILYYRNSAGTISNLLPGAVDGGSNVTLY